MIPKVDTESLPPDSMKGLRGRWEGGIKENIRGSQARTLIIRSVEPTKNGWVATGGFWVEEGVSGYPIGKGIDVSIQDGLIVLQFTNPANDSYRLILTGNNRLEGTLYYAQYRGTGVGMRTYHLSLSKQADRVEY